MFNILVLIGFLSTPVWSIVLCLNGISILRKMRSEEEDYTINTVWFTASATILIWELFAILASIVNGLDVL